VGEYKGLLELTGIEPATTRIADVATDADIALWIHPLQLLCGENFGDGKAEKSASAIDAESSDHFLWGCTGVK
jgi:hypothetical protein